MVLTRRDLVRTAALGSGLLLAGCAGGEATRAPAPDGSTLRGRWVDRDGSGVLSRGPGEPFLGRTELAPASPRRRVLATLAHVTDAHLLDAQSPARVPFLARLGPPFGSTFRPHETLTAQVLAGALRSIAALRPDAVIQGGDLIDNAQGNELDWALAVLRGGTVRAGSGGAAYRGVQEAANDDPLYYRPDLDAPRHPGLLAAAVSPFSSVGARAPWYPVLGDHDLLVAGVLPPTPLTRAIAVGTRAVWELPPDLPGHIAAAVGDSSASPDGLGDPAVINELASRLLHASSVTVPADPARAELAPEEALGLLRGASSLGGRGSRLDYFFDVGVAVRVIVLDLVRRAGGSGGVVVSGQAAWLAAQLAAAGARTVIVVSHQPLDSSAGGAALLAELDRSPRVLAAVWGHTHHNRIRPRRGPNGGYWLISTGSLVDYPQQCRALRVIETARGVALETWMLDHLDGPDSRGLGATARELAYLDVAGGRPQDFAGAPGDRNAVLYRDLTRP